MAIGRSGALACSFFSSASRAFDVIGRRLRLAAGFGSAGLSARSSGRNCTASAMTWPLASSFEIITNHWPFVSKRKRAERDEAAVDGRASFWLTSTVFSPSGCRT